MEKSDRGIKLDEKSSNWKPLSKKVFRAGMFWFKMFAFKTSWGSKCPGQKILCPSHVFVPLPPLHSILRPHWALSLPGAQ